MDKVKISFDQRDRPDDYDLSDRLPIVVMTKISNWKVYRVLIDGGSPRNTIFAGALDVMGVPRSKVKPASQPAVVVPGFPVASIGQITFPVTFGTSENRQTEDVVFDVVDSQTPYNAILGYPALAKFMAVVHFAYRCVKIPGPNGVITVRG